MRDDSGTGSELFIVGDAKQSIYDFRGAEVEVFGEARALLDERVSLAKNFRTIPEILAFINDVFAQSKLLKEVEPMPLRFPSSNALQQVIPFRHCGELRCHLAA